jgi:hypothetical protein
LSCIQSTLLRRERILGTFLHSFFPFSQDHLDVAWIAHVRIDSAVSSVCSSTLLRCLVDLNVLDNQIAGVQAFGVGIGFSVLQERQEEFGGFDWVACSRDTKLFSCVGTMSAPLTSQLT